MRTHRRRHPYAPRIAIVADDLTGACDSGVEFIETARPVVVLVEPGCSLPADVGKGIFAHNTQSRAIGAEAAYVRAVSATESALARGANLIFKKVDSALRGNFGVEIEAVMDAARASLAFIVPAIPEVGRETVDGVQHIDGIPISESFYANDPEHPVTESSVLARAEDGSARRAGLIPLKDVRGRNLVKGTEKLRAQGCQLIVLDARTAEDLHIAVETLVPLPEAKIFVGCQGLARALARQFRSGEEPVQAFVKLDGPLLFLCGTLHPQSRRQLEVATDAGGLLVLDVELSRLMRRAGYGAAMKKLAETCRSALLTGRGVGVCIGGKVTSFSAQVRDSVLGFLSELACRVIESVPLGGLVLTGGETAYSVCRSLGIGALKLHARIAPLVVASTVVGEPRGNMVVITKGGSIGPDDLVSRINKFFTGA